MSLTEESSPPENFDLELSGASVLKVWGNVLTSTGVYTDEVDGVEKPCVKIRVNQKRRVKLFVGDTLELWDGAKLQVTDIVLPPTKTGGGKIYLAKVET